VSEGSTKKNLNWHDCDQGSFYKSFVIVDQSRR
jgi:hypothetical protein